MGSPVAVIALLLPLVRAAANCDRSPTPIYVYDADKIDNPWLAHAVDRLTRNLVPSAVAVADPSDACWFLVTSPAAAAGPFADAVALAAEAPLARLAHWGQCGANHAVFMSEHPDEETPSFDVGGAAVLRYALTKRSFRRGRDVQLPVYYPGAEPHRNYAGARRTDADLDAAAASTARPLLLGFVGTIPAAGTPYVVPAAPSTFGLRSRVVASCARRGGNGAIRGAHSLSNGVVVAHADDESDWGGMWSDHYAAVLANSSYALCPGGAAPYASERLVDAIRAGAAPVVVDDGLLVFPFAGLEDADALWARCAVVATPDLMRYGSRGLLRRLDDERDAGLLPARLEACRSLRDRFLGDADAVVDAAFRALAASARTCDAPLPPCAALNSGGTCAGEPVDAGRDRVRSKPTYRENERDLVDGLRCLRSNAGPGDRLRELALTVAVAEEFILVAAPRLAANEYDVATRLHEELEKNASVAVPPWASRAAGWSHYVLGMLDEQDGLVLDARDHYDAADRLGVARASRHGIQIRDLLAAEPVLLGVETRSWLLKEMATGWRLCGAVACGVSLGDPFEGDHATVYLTTHASNGFPVDFPYVDRPRHANAVVAAYENSAAPGYATEKLFQVRPGGKIIHEPAPIFLYRRYNESRHWRDLEVLTPAAEERVVSPVEARPSRRGRGRLRRLPRGRLRRRPRLPRRGAGGLVRRRARRAAAGRARSRAGSSGAERAASAARFHVVASAAPGDSCGAVAGDAGCRARGYYVDVGFNDARSRTHALDVDRGWRGLCVDPEPEAVGARACAVARVAAGAADRAFAAYARYLGDDGAPTGSLNGTRGRPALFRKKVRTATLGALLDGAAAPPIIDHLHVDTAGSEAEVLRGFPHHARCARRVSVSAAAPKSQRRVHVFLEAHGYVFEGTDRGCDVFYGDCGAFAPSEGAPLLALKSPRPGDERGQSVKVALSADLTAAPEVRRDPDAYDVCFDCGFGKSCHGLRGGLVLPRCDARELGDGLGRVDAWVERREGSRVGPKVWAWLWDDAATALEALRNKTPQNHGRVRLHLGVAHEHLGDGLRARSSAQPRRSASPAPPRASPRSSTAAPRRRGPPAPRRRPGACASRSTAGPWTSEDDGVDFEARFGRDRVVAVAADVAACARRRDALVQKAGLDDGLARVRRGRRALVVRPGDVDGPDLREELGIAANATVFGRHGGVHTFSIDFVKAVVEARAAARPDVVFLFMNTAPFGAPQPNVRFIPGTADPDRVAAFVRTCDAMLHARRRAFGLAVADFARHDRPVLTFDSPDPSYARFHLSVLQRRAIPYRDARSLEKALDAFDRDAARRLPRGYWNAYHPAFGPAAVMDAFDRVFLADGPGETFRRPPPANDEGLPAAAAYLAAG
ncbi:hypothetical protein JL722_2596 [Aureococcus anophagefferens]|nr:hypothetical protein JL722_2596 [Aureococcus anophagefferens]